MLEELRVCRNGRKSKRMQKKYKHNVCLNKRTISMGLSMGRDFDLVYYTGALRLIHPQSYYFFQRYLRTFVLLPEISHFSIPFLNFFSEIVLKTYFTLF